MTSSRIFLLGLLLPVLLIAAGCGSSIPDDPSEPEGITLNKGDFLVTDTYYGALFRVDPATGNRDVVSSQLSGIPRQMAVDADGTILIALSDDWLPVIIRVSPSSGLLSIVSSGGSDLDSTVPFIGDGGRFRAPFGLIREASGQLLVGNQSVAAIHRVDPVSGDRTVVSDRPRGAGPPIFGPIQQFARESGGTLLITVASTADSAGAIMRVDPTTGDRTVLSSGSTGAGPTFGTPVGIALDPGGNIFVTDPIISTLFRVDPVTGDRTVVSGSTVGEGEALFNPHGLAFDSEGRLFVADESLILQVDLDNGNRTVVSAPTVGTGPAFQQAEDIVTFVLP